MNKPVRTTVVFGLVSAFLMLPLLWYQDARGAWPGALEAAVWADLAVYALLLCRFL